MKTVKIPEDMLTEIKRHIVLGLSLSHTIQDFVAKAIEEKLKEERK